MLKDVLQGAMRSRGMSTREAAREIGISHTTVFRVIKGDPFDVDTLIAIANWLKVRPSTLLDSLARSDTIGDLSLLIERYPGILDVLKQASVAVNQGAASQEILVDILSYALYKLSLRGDKDGPSTKSGGKETSEAR